MKSDKSKKSSRNKSNKNEKSSCKKSEKSVFKKKLRPHINVLDLQINLRRAEKKLLQYEIGLLIHTLVIEAEKRWGSEYDEETFKALMLNKYNDADQYELNDTNCHYKIWQYIINFVDNSDYRIVKFRKKYGRKSKREKCHEFCLTMETAGKLFSCNVVKDWVIILTEKKPFHTLTKKEIFQNLNQFTKFDQKELKHIINFLEFWNVND